jgi:hypothetical protein
VKLHVVEGRYAVARLNAADPIPSWPRGNFVAITRTRDELSIVCDDAAVPDDVRAERGWRCLAVDGPIPFEMIGVAAAIANTLADAAISVFFVSTFDTDYLLVKEESFSRACEFLDVVS